MKKKIIKVSGMHCKSCELLLEKEFSKLKGLKKVNVSHKKGLLEMLVGPNFDLKIAENIIEKCGYKVGYAKQESSFDFGQVLIAFFLTSILAWLFLQFDLFSLLPEQGAQVSFLVALLLGFVASVSTCMALVGGIIIGFSATYPVQEDKNNRFYHRALPHLQFHLGRLLSFAFLGGLLGLLGQKLNLSLGFTGFLTILIAIVMLYIGLQLLGIVPNITKLGFHLPKAISSKITQLEKKENPLIPIVIGAMTFFLPCGFTQSMQLAAIASGSFASGAMIMTFFAIGTIPALFVIGLSSTYIRQNKFAFMQKLIGMIVVFFAFYSFNSGLVLAGSGFTLDFWNSAPAGQQTATVYYDDYQLVKMDVNYVFEQNTFRIKAGVPVRWEINAIKTTGCSDEVIIPRLGLTSGKLKPGVNVIEFTPQEKGVLPFSCWMGMQSGKFIIE